MRLYYGLCFRGLAGTFESPAIERIVLLGVNKMSASIEGKHLVVALSGDCLTHPRFYQRLPEKAIDDFNFWRCVP